MDKSKGEPVISVKTSTTSKDRVSDASAWETFSLVQIFSRILNPARLFRTHTCLANLSNQSFSNMVLISKIPLIWLIQHSNPA